MTELHPPHSDTDPTPGRAKTAGLKPLGGVVAAGVVVSGTSLANHTNCAGSQKDDHIHRHGRPVAGKQTVYLGLKKTSLTDETSDRMNVLVERLGQFADKDFRLVPGAVRWAEDTVIPLPGGKLLYAEFYDNNVASDERGYVMDALKRDGHRRFVEFGHDEMNNLRGGDVLYDPTKGILFFSYDTETQKTAMRETLEKNSGLRVVAIPRSDSETSPSGIRPFYHLDTFMNILPGGEALIHPAATDAATMKTLKAIYGDGLIETDRYSALGYASNLIAGKDKTGTPLVLFPSDVSAELRDNLARRGYRTETPGDVGLETHLPTCLSLTAATAAPTGRAYRNALKLLEESGNRPLDAQQLALACKAGGLTFEIRDKSILLKHADTNSYVTVPHLKGQPVSENSAVYCGELRETLYALAADPDMQAMTKTRDQLTEHFKHNPTLSIEGIATPHSADPSYISGKIKIVHAASFVRYSKAEQETARMNQRCNTYDRSYQHNGNPSLGGVRQSTDVGYLSLQGGPECNTLEMLPDISPQEAIHRGLRSGTLDAAKADALARRHGMIFRPNEQGGTLTYPDGAIHGLDVSKPFEQSRVVTMESIQRDMARALPTTAHFALPNIPSPQPSTAIPQR